MARLLGDHGHTKGVFPGVDAALKEFEGAEFRALADRKRSEWVNRALLGLIQGEPEPCFLLSSVLDFISRVEEEKALQHYTFTSFEVWLNHYSGLSFEENGRVRGKIAGKWIDRSDYQIYFPIGMGKIYEGTHFVTAHKSPDLDTTIASFWGWLDAFAARVGDGLHVWNLPGGPPASQIEIEWLFNDLFGAGVFTHLSKTRTALTLTGNDLMTQRGLHKRTPADSIGESEHEKEQTAIVIVDKEGFYLGDWRGADVEGVRQVIILLSSCLRWFENHLHLQLITLLAKPVLSSKEIEPFLHELFSKNLGECEPALEFAPKQKQQVADFLTRVLGIKEGLSCHFEQLGIHLAKMGEVPFESVANLASAMKGLFDAKGQLLEERPRIFSFLENAIRHLHEAIFKIRLRLERLDIAMKTKMDVFGHHLNYVTVRTDIEEIRSKMGFYPYLTVTYPDQGKMVPVGIVQAADLRKSVLGTVSLRDFCNRDEMSIPPYLDVISVIDHHKSQLHTFSPPMAIIADAQSSNTLVANLAFQINDRYSVGVQGKASLEAEIQEHIKLKTPVALRILQRLFQKQIAAQSKASYFVHPEREFIEYLHFLYGIIDDTDLLSKVSAVDVEIVASLLNRLKSLLVGKEGEIISLDDLPRDGSFAKKAAKRILQNEDMYSLYRKAYAYREKEVEKNLEKAAREEPSNLFADTKEQNGCCRIGQTKVFASNIPFFEKQADAIRKTWLKGSQEVHKKRGELDLHMHMISTIVSADEVYRGQKSENSHKDELWIWIPSVELAIEHLKIFLNAFGASPVMRNNGSEVEFLGSNGDELAMIFKESFAGIPQKASNKRGIPIAVLRYKAGSLNSRKAMVSPFLPTLTA